MIKNSTPHGQSLINIIKNNQTINSHNQHYYLKTIILTTYHHQ